MALVAKNKIDFVDGMEIAPDPSDSSFAAWRKANVLVLGWILKAVSSEIPQSVIWLDSARDVWLDLQEQFNADEFAMFRPVSACSCQPRCPYDALTKVREYFRTEHIICFLKGLNPYFSAVRSQIIRLPSINSVFSMVAQEEQEIYGGRGEVTEAQQAAGIIKDSTPRVFAASNSAGQSFKKGKRSLCTHYGLIGHNIDKCYKKNGYPPGYRTK
ncbi:hypothetical protein LINPERHAP1_LOCUS21300 [Linum perenne]